MIQKFPEDLVTLISLLKKLPGVGTKTAERFAFELIRWEDEALITLGTSLQTIQKKIPPCSICGCLTQEGHCTFCKGRETHTLCIISSARDAYSIEETGHFRGLYHVIEHLISPLDGRLVNQLRTDRIEARIVEQHVREVIIAFDSTLEGDTTALYLKKVLAHLPITISRLAFGLPVGSSLEYIDSGTLSRALSGRQQV